LRVSLSESIHTGGSLNNLVTMVSATLTMVASLVVTLPMLVSSAGICKWDGYEMKSSSFKWTFANPHTFIQTENACVLKDREAFGCNLMDFARNKTWSDAGMQTQAHWNLLEGPPDRFKLGHYVSADTCAHYPVPDYCARAMLSELSTVYNGRKRYTSTAAGAALLLSGAGAKQTGTCGTESEEKPKLEQVFTSERVGKACWNMVNDWKHLYCSGYNKCICENNDLEQCHRNNEKVQCCRDRFQEFLNSKYNAVRSAGSLLDVRGHVHVPPGDVAPEHKELNINGHFHGSHNITLGPHV